MRDKIAPWLPAGFCVVLAVIVTIANLWAYANGGSDGSATMIFMLFLPMCFFFVGAYLTQLRNENREIVARLDELTRKA
jgi:peptidoglycan/LPS O-acetylase OafA/YrhL